MTGTDWDHIVYPGDRGGYEVEPGQKGKAYDGFLRSGGLDKCIAVGAVNLSEEVGYLKHIAGFTKELDDFAQDLDDFINDIQNETSDEDSMQYILGGSNYDHQDLDLDSKINTILHDLQNIGGQRMIAEELLSTRVERYDSEWGSEEGFTSELILDTNGLPSFIYDREFDEHEDERSL
ncbi:MAG: hypothetical protein BRC30_00415 [Nanohaloarchaea archaeon SW_7_46_7]|nr:MAG: hypothetical protein BRC30_00415 [Nanohaloarchaea archaeon SW_7_46_7]